MDEEKHILTLKKVIEHQREIINALRSENILLRDNIETLKKEVELLENDVEGYMKGYDSYKMC